MPEHYADWWWEDLPEKARKAARALGYDKHIWDDDEETPYADKAMNEVSPAEKTAARYLGMDPTHEKLDIWWEDADEETKKYAQVLGWDQHKWDHDWEIQDLPCEHWYWKDMTSEQKEAARYFGYNKSLWDETEDDDEEEEEEEWKPAAPVSLATPSNVATVDETPDEKKDEEEEEEDKKKKKKKKKKQFSVSKAFGGDGGEAFNHRNHKSIKSITVRTDGHAIHHIAMVYHGNDKKEDGEKHGKQESLELADGEYVKSVKVRSNKIVQSLTFNTNKGQSLTVGGKGWDRLIGSYDKEGKEHPLNAPKGCQLCGIQGRAGKYIDQIAFRWGPIPGEN